MTLLIVNPTKQPAIGQHTQKHTLRNDLLVTVKLMLVNKPIPSEK